MKITTPSLEFFKPTLATTLAIVLAWLPSVRPAQAGYTVTLQQVGLDVVATGSGAIDGCPSTQERETRGVMGKKTSQRIISQARNNAKSSS
jgi:hypothetical protein